MQDVTLAERFRVVPLQEIEGYTPPFLQKATYSTPCNRIPNLLPIMTVEGIPPILPKDKHLLSQTLVRRARPFDYILPYIRHAQEAGMIDLVKDLIMLALLSNIFRDYRCGRSREPELRTALSRGGGDCSGVF